MLSLSGGNAAVEKHISIRCLRWLRYDGQRVLIFV